MTLYLPNDQDETLPPFLRITEPLEPEDIPLQVALLTMEIAALRQVLMALQTRLDDHAR